MKVEVQRTRTVAPPRATTQDFDFDVQRRASAPASFSRDFIEEQLRIQKVASSGSLLKGGRVLLPRLLVALALTAMFVFFLGRSSGTQAPGGEVGGRRFRRSLPDLLTSLEATVARKADVEVADDIDEYDVDRDSLFGDMDDHEIYDKYWHHDEQFFTIVKMRVQRLTGALNVVAVRKGTIVKVEHMLADISLKFTGGIDAEYRVVAFNGIGMVDRTGMDGGYKNWSWRGHHEREGMKLIFYDQSLLTGSCSNPEDCGNVSAMAEKSVTA